MVGKAKPAKGSKPAVVNGGRKEKAVKEKVVEPVVEDSSDDSKDDEHFDESAISGSDDSDAFDVEMDSDDDEDEAIKNAILKQLAKGGVVELDTGKDEEEDSEEDDNEEEDDDENLQTLSDMIDEDEEDGGDYEDDEEMQDLPDMVRTNGKEIMLEDLSDQDEDIVPTQRVTINNKPALERIYNEINLSLPFIETQAVTTAAPLDIPNPEDDLEREMAFYKQALSAAQEGRKKLQTLGVPFTRPNDYFAEMVKSDDHMQRVRQRLLDDDAALKASENARKQRQLKKFGKAVQIEKQKSRQKEKSDMLDKVKSLKRKRKDGEGGDDGFDIELDDAIADPRGEGNNRRGSNRKGGISRKKRDEKYGFGGKKRHAKSNTAESTGDMRSFDSKKMKKPFRGSKQKGKSSNKPNRPGKARRQSK